MRLLTLSATALLLLMSPEYTEAQNPQPLRPSNFGLTAYQPDSELPHSEVPFTVPVRAEKGVVEARLIPDGRNSWLVADGWELADEDAVVANGNSLFAKDYDTSSWYRAVVPGTVLTSLVAAGIYPDPYYGLDNLSIPDDLCRREWWYRIRFDSPQSAEGRRAVLCFDGINYRADVWFNGRKAGHIDGAFVRGEFDVTDILEESNVLAVKIYPPANPGIPHEESKASGRGPNGGQLCLDGPTFISSEGWDWIPGIRDRNIGIWQNVRLKYTGAVTIADPQVITDLPLPDTSYADLRFRADISNHDDKPRKVVLRGVLEGKTIFTIPAELAAGQTRTVTCTAAGYPDMRLDNPRLWWPNGYGEQNLYTLHIEAECGDLCSDACDVRFGVREFTYELTAESPAGEELRFEFSPTDDPGDGKPLFDTFRRRSAAGETVIPSFRADADISRLRIIGPDATAPFLVIRCNGVRIFCRGGNWGMDDGMKRVSRERLEPAMRLHREEGFNMVRNWTGESTEELFYELCDEYGMMVWNDFWLSTEGYNLNVNDEELFVTNARDVVRRFRNHPSIALWCPRNEGYAPPTLETRLAELVASEDGTRYYSPNSRYMNLRPSGPWHWLADESEYFTEHAHGFSTELGTPSVPTAESMRKFIPEPDCWPISDTWYYHDLHFGLTEYVGAVEQRFGKAESLDDFCRKVQMINYDSHRAMLEAWNSRMWNSTSGVLLWMSHPAWPSVEWQTYSWDFETHGSYYGCRKACEPLHVQMNPHDNKVLVVNTTRQECRNGEVVVSVLTPDGRLLSKRSAKVGIITANGLCEVMNGDFTEGDKCRIVRLELFADGRRVSVNDYLRSPGNDFTPLDALPAPRLRARKLSGSGFEIVNAGRTTAIAVKFNIRNAVTGEALLPAYISEGYINLLPGERRVVKFDCASDLPAVLSAEGYNFGRQTLLNL